MLFFLISPNLKSMPEEKNLSKIKTSIFSRSLSLAKLTLGSGGKLLASKLSTALKSQDAKEAFEQFLIERAEEFADEFGKLKGSIMKAGQLLSMYGEYFLPKEANEFLKTLQSSSPPLAFEEILKIIKKELGDKTQQLIIDPKPIGSASLGQVHRAQEIRTGRWIALKVQYPGVAGAIDSDLRALRSMMQVINLIPKTKGVDQIFGEIREMLIQELNYPYEVEETKKYAARLAGDSRFKVPAIIDDYCSEHIIATEYISFSRVDSPAVQNLSEERRARLAQNFMDLYFQELFDWGVVQTDPHLGNYGVQIDSSGQGEDVLVLFDFGATRYYPEDFLYPYYQMIQASLQNDRAHLRKAALSLKFIYPDDPPELVELFEQFCLGTVEPFLLPDDPRVKNDPYMLPNGRYDWSRSELPQRMSQIGWQMIKKFDLRAPPPEILFLDRKTGGVFVFVANLKAPVAGRHLLLPAITKGLHRLELRRTQGESPPRNKRAPITTRNTPQA